MCPQKSIDDLIKVSSKATQTMDTSPAVIDLPLKKASELKDGKKYYVHALEKVPLNVCNIGDLVLATLSECNEDDLEEPQFQVLLPNRGSIILQVSINNMFSAEDFCEC